MRVLVAIQQPRDLDTAYTLALLYEELGDGSTPLNVHSPVSSSRRVQPLLLPPPLPPSRWLTKQPEEKKSAKPSRQQTEEKWNSLKAYRRAKGSCFVCGEKWGREHKCGNTIQLHIVQEMIEFLQQPDSEDEAAQGEEMGSVSLLLSAAAHHVGEKAPKTMLLQVTVQGCDMVFLVDSGSSTCFVDSKLSGKLQGEIEMPRKMNVKVAGGRILTSTKAFPALIWSSQGYEFTDCF